MRGQRAVVFKHLKEKGSITSMEAFQLYGATRLSAIIFDLRKAGHVIDTVYQETITRYGEHCRYAEYVMKKEEK